MNDCMMTMVLCPYEEAGCNFNVSKVDEDVFIKCHYFRWSYYTDGRKIPICNNVKI